MGAHNICSKTDRALVAYLVSLGIPGKIYSAKRSLDKDLPFTVCWSHSANPPQDDPHSGNQNVEAFVEIRSSGVIESGDAEDKPRLDDDALVALVFDAFYTTSDDQSSSDLAESITAAARASTHPDLADFTCQSCRVVGQTQGFNPRNIREQGNAWIDSIHLEMLCSPSNVS